MHDGHLAGALVAAPSAGSELVRLTLGLALEGELERESAYPRGSARGDLPSSQSNLSALGQVVDLLLLDVLL